MKKAISYTLTILLAITMTLPVTAQSLEDLIDAGCNVGSKLPGDWSWICRAGNLITGLSDDFEALYTDFAEFGAELFDNFYDDAITTFAGQIDPSVIDEALNTIENAMDEGPEALKEAITEVTSDVRLSHLLELKNAEPEDLIAALKNPNELRTYKQMQLIAEKANPNIRLAMAELFQRQEDVLNTQGEAEVIQLETQKLAQEVIEDTSVRDTMAEVLAPQIPLIPDSGGTAIKLEESAKTAVSTRAAVQVLSEGIADLMRQEAVLSGSVNEHLKTLAQQQVLTSWQLKLQTNALNEQINQEIEKQKRELENAIAEQYETSANAAEQLAIIGNNFKSFAQKDLPTFAELGW